MGGADGAHPAANVACVEGTPVTPELIIRAVLELVFLLAVLAALLFFTDLRKKLFPLGASALVWVFVFIGAWGVVQMLDRWQYDYPQAVSFIPLTRFAMYQAQIPESVESTYAWEAETAEGETIDVNVAAEFSSVGLPPMSTRMRVLLGWMHEGEDGEHYQEAVDELELYGEALVAALDEDGVEVDSLAFLRVTGHPGDTETELLIDWDAEELVDA